MALGQMQRNKLDDGDDLAPRNAAVSEERALNRKQISIT
jgi:hypothetical protein